MKSVIKIAFCGIVALSQSAYARSVMNTNSASGSRAGDAALIRTNEIPKAETPQLTATQGLQQNGQNASDKQNAGKMAALASAAFSAALAAATCPQKPTPPTCPAAIMGALAGMMMAGMMNDAKNKSDAQASGVTAGAKVVEQPIEQNRSYQETKRKISTAAKAAGASIDTDKGVARLADGRTLDLKSLASGSGGSSGMKPGELKAFGDIMKEAGKKGDIAMKATDGDPNAGGSDGGGGGVTAVYGSSSGGGGGDTARRTPASVEGAVRDFNGTPIGVSVDSIWTMMNRRYAHELDNKKLNN